MAKDKMGFGSDRLFRRKFGNVPCHVTIDGTEYHFKSKFEYRYAQYLEILRTQGHPNDKWFYESTTYTFQQETRGAKVYTPDFRVWTNDKLILHETKGMLSGSDVTKFKRMAKYYPGVKIILIFMNKDKKRANRLRTAEKYVDEVRYFGPTLNKLKGWIDMS